MSLVENQIVTAYVGLGSDLGDRAGNLMLAVRGLIEASLVVTKLSSIYETEPVAMDDAPPFLNMVAEVRVENISPTQMMARMLRIEYLLGRKDKSMNLPRTIDLDLLFYGDTKLETPFLTLPHPRVPVRNFILVPLNEIAPNFVHPFLKKCVSDLVAQSPDCSRVSRWNPFPNNGLPRTTRC